jgi:hypothetical protein
MLGRWSRENISEKCLKNRIFVSMTHSISAAIRKKDPVRLRDQLLALDKLAYNLFMGKFKHVFLIENLKNARAEPLRNSSYIFCFSES